MYGDPRFDKVSGNGCGTKGIHHRGHRDHRVGWRVRVGGSQFHLYSVAWRNDGFK